MPAILSGQISYETPRMGLYVQNNRYNRSLSNGGRSDESAPIHQSNGNNDSSVSGVTTGQEIQRMGPSYPSMSSLGRISSYNEYHPHWAMMEGEVLMRRNSSSST